MNVSLDCRKRISAYLVSGTAGYATENALGSTRDAVDDGLESRGLFVGRHVD